MKIKHQLSIATLVMVGVFATGCSQQSAGGSQVDGGGQVAGGGQVSGSQQQVEAAVPAVVAAPAVVEPVAAPMAPAPRVAPVRKAPARQWGHYHPAIPRCTDSVRHNHKSNNANHHHKYSCRKPAMHHAAPAKPVVNVEAMQRKLKAKGYYKGPIDGVVGPATRSALKRFMAR